MKQPREAGRGARTAPSRKRSFLPSTRPKGDIEGRAVRLAIPGVYRDRLYESVRRGRRAGPGPTTRRSCTSLLYRRRRPGSKISNRASDLRGRYWDRTSDLFGVKWAGCVQVVLVHPTEPALSCRFAPDMNAASHVS